MSKTFKKEFIANGLVAHIIKRESGKNSWCYEIRYRSNGYKIEASSTNLAEAKRKFLEKTTAENIGKYKTNPFKRNTDSFQDVFYEFYECKKQDTITPKTLKGYLLRFNSVPQILKNKSIREWRSKDILSCLDKLAPRDYEEMRTMFSGVFKYAVANGLSSINPVAQIPFKRAKRNNRDALSEEELQLFLSNIEKPEFTKIRKVAFMYYFFGLRASEIDHETRIENGFLITRNRKRKKGEIEYKKIPVPKEAQGLIDFGTGFVLDISATTAGRLFKKLLGENRSAYNLRHTFCSICSQYVRDDIVELWMGDSPEKLIGKVYTHYPDRFMREQMDLVEFPIP